MSPRGACFYFDDEFRRKIEEPVVNAKRSLERRELSHTDMVDVVTEVEFSEWNELFIYTLDTTKALDDNFRQAISDIDQHRQHVQEYVSSLPDGEAFLEKLEIPPTARAEERAPHDFRKIAEALSSALD